MFGWGGVCTNNLEIQIKNFSKIVISVSLLRCQYVLTQVAQARNMSIGEHRQCCVTF